MELSTTAINRLSTLANFMDSLQVRWPNQFDMRNWQGSGSLWCGTRACAAGWGTTLPEFAAAGFRASSKGTLYFDGHRDWKAVNAFFDLNEKQSEHLFGVELHDVVETPQQWAEHCRAFLRKQGVQDGQFQKFMAKAQEKVAL